MEADFIAKMEEIKSLSVWVCFPILPAEHYKESLLNKAGDQIGKTIKVDNTTKVATRGTFFRVCVEVDLTKPLNAGNSKRKRMVPLI